MSMLGFVLGLALTAAALAGAASLVVALLVPVVGWLKLGSARRADLALLGGLLPAVAAVVGAALAALPTALAWLGVAPDHCLQHNHHWHLCPEHLGGFPAWMALCGAAAFAVAVARAGIRAVDARHQHRLVRAVAQVGARSLLEDGTPIVVVDGPPTLLHAAGNIVIASRSLLTALSDASRRAALHHEAAHVRRGDSRWLVVLSLAAAFAPPGFGSWMLGFYRQAAEEVADEEAAVVVGAVDVAAAVVDVSRLRERSLLDGLPATDGADIERRVLRLLAVTPRPSRSGAAVVVAALMLAAALAVPFYEDVHHLAESALAHVESARHPDT